MATQDKLESVSEVFREELVHTKCATINTTPVGKYSNKVCIKVVALYFVVVLHC